MKLLLLTACSSKSTTPSTQCMCSISHTALPLTVQYSYTQWVLGSISNIKLYTVCSISHTALYTTCTVHISHTALPSLYSTPIHGEQYLSYNPIHTVQYIPYSPAPALCPHCVDGLSLHPGYVVASCLHCLDGIPTIETLHISDRHIVTLHAHRPGEGEGRGGEGRRGDGRRLLYILIHQTGDSE